MATAPNRYDDPYYTQLAASTEQKLDLPVGLLSSIVTRGEKSNADQVSSAGARTVFQITPTTRKLVLDRDGIDAYLSPENAAEVAGLVAKDGVNWAKTQTSDPAQIERMAVGYYHAGGDTDNWGPKTTAYIARVVPGVQAAKKDALNNDFASYMAANPAVPPDSQRPQPAAAPGAQSAAPTDALSQDFGAWKQQQDLTSQFPNRDYKSAQIPGSPTKLDEQGRPYIDNTPNAPATIGDKAIGAGEAALSAATGLVGYPVALGSVVKDLGTAAINKMQGGAPLPDNVDANANAAGAAVTYAPRTDVGQQYAQSLGEAMQPLAGLAPAEAAALHAGAAPIVQSVRSVARAAPGAAIDAAQSIGNAAGTAASTVGDAVGGLIGKARSAAPEAAAEPTAGTMGSVGSAGTDMATQRQQAAASLPVPINLTKGQASRSFEQLRFEEETAKDGKLGEALRENSADQNARVPQNFDRMIDQTGAETVAPADVGRAVVDNGLVKDAAKAKAAYNAKYKLAEAAGQMQDPVSLQSVIDHLNDSAPEATTAPLLTTARSLAIKLGIARDEDGTLVANTADAPAPARAPSRGTLWGEPPPAVAPPPAASEVTLATAERFRQAINRNTGIEPTNVRQATILKSLIDQSTEGAGGELYTQARKARQRYAQLYEDNAVVSDLLNARKGTSDRKVALENVFDRTILNGSREDLGKLRRTLQVGGSENGAQAWRELQGATLRYLNEESTKGVGTDIHGNPIVSAARLNNAVRALDASGKLDFILGKRGASQVRDLNEIVKVIKTSPPGSVNFSNTASVLLGALSDFKTVGGGAAESALMGALTGMPIPVLTGIRTGLRVIKQSAANRETLRRVDEALGRVRAKEKQSKAPRVPMPPAKNIH